MAFHIPRSPSLRNVLHTSTLSRLGIVGSYRTPSWQSQALKGPRVHSRVIVTTSDRSSRGECSEDDGVTWQPLEHIDEFVARCLPSEQCRKPWIIVKNPWDKDHPKGDVESARMVLQRPLRESVTELNAIILDDRLNRNQKAAAKRQVALELKETILNTAARFGIVSGKWILFTTQSSIDSIWRDIAVGTHDGVLGSSAQVSTKNENSMHVVFVHTSDFTNLKDVRRVLLGLSKLGLCKKRSLGYKPTIYSLLQIGNANSYQLRPAIFSSRELLEESREEDQKEKQKYKE